MNSTRVGLETSVAETPKAKPRATIDIERFRELYGYGLSDRHLARRLGCSHSGVRYQREALGLPPNKKTGAQPMPKSRRDARLALYRQGFSDGQIAKIEGKHPVTICKWRKENGLPAKRPPLACDLAQRLDPNENRRRLAAYNRGLSDSALGAALGISKAAAEKWRRTRNLPAFDPKATYRAPPTSIVSLDAELGEGGFNRYDFIADDAAAQWLEENGSTVW